LPVNHVDEGHNLADLKCSTYCLEKGHWWGGREGAGGRGGEGRGGGSGPMTAPEE